MTREEQIERVLAVILEGGGRAKIAEALRISEEEVGKWLADPDLLFAARRALTDRILAMIPRTLERLDELLDSESDTQAMNAIKLVIKQLETADKYDEDKLRKAVQPIVDAVMQTMEQKHIADEEMKPKEDDDDGLGNTEKTTPQE
ncbi:MAG: hypothetical protein GY771_14105 [bacterium]|nr:hypothetical protein [bacterium]